ncbi:MAG: DUF309 domain-containing protein [Leptospirales bacterium]|nr:DUF309 domain-containing protein [Leptospirales bacterium]
MDESWHEFVQAFNSGRFYAAHEAAERIWASRGYPPYDVFRGLTQLAVALAHIQKGNLIGAARVLRKASDLLIVPSCPFWTAEVVRETESLLLAEDPTAALMRERLWIPEAFDQSMLHQPDGPRRSD